MSVTRGPTEQDRVIVIGRTGSGKSQFAVALLATRNFDEMPWVIIDYKGEDLIQDIMIACGGNKKSLKGGAIKVISPYDEPPHKPGLYYMSPRVREDDDAVNRFLYRCYDEMRGPFGKKCRGHIGLFIDEGYALPDRGAKGPFDQILVQGRSLYIPVIALYQRPVWMGRFAIAQANFFALFDQNDLRDWKTVDQFIRPPKGDNIPPNITLNGLFSVLPDYYYVWYDVGRGVSSVLKPASSRLIIINSFVNRLVPIHKRRALI